MANKAREPEEKIVEHVDPISGEISDIVTPPRVRARDIFLDDLGREIPDPRPMQPPIGYKKQPSMFELIREATAREVALYAAGREPETFEESDDFDIDDDIDPSSPWENDFDPPWSEVRQAIEDNRRKASESPPEPKPTVPETPPLAPAKDPIA